MGRYSTLRRELEAALKSRLGAFGYVKQSKGLSDSYAKKSPDGLHGIHCKIDARYDISLCLSFRLRFDIVSDVMQLIYEETNKRHPELIRLDAKTEAYYAAAGYNFECTYGELVGLYRFAADTIETESELEALLQRTLQRINDHGTPYFDKYGNIDEVVRVILTNSPERQYLIVSSSQFVVTGAATLFAARGRDAMLEYVNGHTHDPNLNKWEKEQLQLLVDVSELERSRR